MGLRTGRTAAIALALVLGSSTAPGCSCEEQGLLDPESPVLALEPAALDFGAVPEGSELLLTLTVSNLGRVPLHVGATLDAGASADFSITGSTELELAAGGVAELPVRFAPSGSGEDEGTITLVSDDPARPTVGVALHGGPIAPAIAVLPDPVEFAPEGQREVRKPLLVRNVGDARLTLSLIGLRPDGNPDFSLAELPAPGASLWPGEELQVVVVYARSTRDLPGHLVAGSDDPVTPQLEVELVADPVGECGDLQDNDGDGLTDAPDDPGCLDVDDDDERNDTIACIDGAERACGSDVGECRAGRQLCQGNLFGDCEGAVLAQPESCDGLDNDCDDRTDEEVVEACVLGACAGARTCVEGAGIAGGLFEECVPVGAEPERCDGLDNDCDGSPDEDVTQACLLNGCAGSQSCIPGSGGQFSACEVVPAAEICNGLDDDCNGTADDGIPDLTCGLGACAQTAPACVDGAPGSCVPGTPGAETCNGVDDDCNGVVDDDCCPNQVVTWQIPPGTVGGPACITTGGGTCSGMGDCARYGCGTGSNWCGSPHCGTLRCNDGSYVRADYCSVYASCQGGGIQATSFSW